MELGKAATLPQTSQLCQAYFLKPSASPLNVTGKTGRALNQEAKPLSQADRVTWPALIPGASVTFIKWLGQTLSSF